MVKIISDSTCDLTRDILAKYNITLTPLYIQTEEGDSFRDGVDITPSDLFRMVDKEKKTCKTAAVNIFDYEQVFAECSAKFDAVIHFNISQGFSSCNQNANIAAEDFENVHVIDTRNLSTGSGYIVHSAAIMAKEGKSAEEILKWAGEAVDRVDASFVIDRLDYLHKGGRCSLAKLISAKLFNIKPCIEVVGGLMEVGAKYVGKFEIVLEKYVRDRLETLSKEGKLDLSRIYITHTTCTPETVEMVRGEIAKYADFAEVIETQAGCTISNHCGPNTLGILFMRTMPKEAVS